ncbi:MAG: glycosyltransferase, partial [Chitinophagia bacterium]|nr:glycosyltransferase [Chitinophagia bacterium]
MSVLLFLFYVVTFAYMLLIAFYFKGWQEQAEYIVPANYIPQTPISIIIPARNEQKNIDACIDSILAQRYPQDLYEIIVVNDHSEDDTAAIVKHYNDSRITLLELEDHLPIGKQINAYKKEALAAGIAQAKHPLIITTDADCIAPK